MTLRPVSPILACLHFQPQVVAFAGPLADAGEHGGTAVGGGDAGDQFLEDDRLAQSGAAEQPGLAAADEGRQQVDDLDARLEDFRLRREVGDRRGIAMDGPVLFGVDGAAIVDRFAQQVEDAAQRGLAHRHADRSAGVDAGHAADHAVGAAQGDAADAAAAKLGLDLAGEADLHALLLGLDRHGVIDRRQMVLGELRVEGRADDLGHAADVGLRGGGGVSVVGMENGLQLEIENCKLQIENCKLQIADGKCSYYLSFLDHDCLRSRPICR